MPFLAEKIFMSIQLIALGKESRAKNMMDICCSCAEQKMNTSWGGFSKRHAFPLGKPWTM
jgi:hypothetical protein